MKRKQLRSLIIKEMKTLIQDDALIPGSRISDIGTGSIIPDVDVDMQDSESWEDESWQENYGEDHDDHDHSGSYMSKPQLYNIAKNAMDIFNSIESGEVIEPWMESYISQASLMLNNVSNSMGYRESSLSHEDIDISIAGIEN